MTSETAERPEKGSGEELARRLIREHGTRLYATAVRLCGNEADSEDIVSRTIARAVERFATFAGGSAEFTWLCAIMVNFRRMDARRKGANSLVFPEEMPETADARPTPAEKLEKADDARAIRRAVAALPEQLRAAVVLHYFNGMTVPAIASALGEPEGTIYYRLHDAKSRIREKIEKHSTDGASRRI